MVLGEIQPLNQLVRGVRDSILDLIELIKVLKERLGKVLKIKTRSVGGRKGESFKAV